MPISKRAESVHKQEHDLYKTGDPDVPDAITDGNGDVALGLCRRCGRGEAELVEPCLQRVQTEEYQAEKNKKYAEQYSASPLASRIVAAPKFHDNDDPLWQGPCGAGWNGGVTQSMLVRFLSCRERFRLKYVCGLEPYDKWHHTFGYGNMWHTCEEALAAGWTNDANLQMLTEHTEEQLNKYPLQREEILKWYNVCAVQFPEYVEHYKDHADVKNRKPLMQERAFDVPYRLPSGRIVRLRGKWDSVDLIEPGECDCGADRTGPSAEAHSDSCPRNGPWVNYGNGPTGGIFLQENKTRGDIDKLQVERQLAFDLQTMMYLIALNSWQHMAVKCLDRELKPGMIELLDEKRQGYPILGVRYNVVRRPLSGGVGSIRMHKATKNKPAETEEEFYERLRRDYIAADPEHWFFRVWSHVSARDIQVFKETCLDPMLEHLCNWYERIVHNVIPTAGLDIAYHYRTPFGVYSALEEAGATEYDACLETGSTAGLRRVDKLFPELE